MKSNPSCYDPATARMELRRFLPVMVLYMLVLGLMTMVIIIGEHTDEQAMVFGMRGFISTMAFVNFVYAVVLVQLLFGDLYTARLCYAIHALPITRGGFFGTQIILGLTASLIPNTLTAIVMLPFLGRFQFLALVWLAYSMLQFLCCFGISVFSAMMAGNRLGMLAVNFIVQFFALLVYWCAAHVYNPLVYGVVFAEKMFTQWSPEFTMLTMGTLNISVSSFQPEGSSNWVNQVDKVELAGDWVQLLIYAAVGVAAIVLAMRLYRKRKLECCGDLLAFEKANLGFLVMATVGCGAVLHIFGESFRTGFAYGMLFAGMIVGYLAALMLIRRDVRVFSKPNLMPLAGILAVVLLTLTLTGMDVLGLTDRMPEESKIQSASIGPYYGGAQFKGSTPEEIAAVRSIHESILSDYHAEQEGFSPVMQIFRSKENRDGSVQDAEGLYHETSLYKITYTLTDGSEFTRQYRIGELNSCYGSLRKALSTPQAIFWNTNLTPEEILNSVSYVTFQCNHEAERDPSWEALGIAKDDYRYETRRPMQIITEPEEIRGLLDAYLRDCEAGVTAMDWIFMRDTTDEIGLQTPEMENYYAFWLRLNEDCTNTLNWLTAHGYHDPL